MVSLDTEIILSEYSYPEFKYIQDRIKSYSDFPWPISLKQTPISLSKAGFFYSGIGDVVICYYCGLNLYKWLQDDIPIIEHVKFSGDCVYARLLRSSQNICQTITFTKRIKLLFGSNIKFLKQISSSGSISNNIVTDPNCKICLSDYANILFLPCNYLCCCISCSLCINVCPICRCNILSLIKVYLS